MGKEENIGNELRSRFGEKIKEIVIQRPRRMFVAVGRENMREIILYLHAHMEMKHVSTITGKDVGDSLEALYHLNDGSISLTIRVTVPKDDPHIPSLNDIFPGSVFYEKELESELGFLVDGLPKGRRYPVAEDWPIDVFPLRKDWPAKKGEKEKE